MMQVYILTEAFLMHAFVFFIWFLADQNLTILLTTALFYLFKFFSDFSIFIEIPKNHFWKNFTISDYIIKRNYFFDSNVDPYFAINLIMLIYLFQNSFFDNKKVLKYVLFTFGILNCFAIYFIEILLKLNYSFTFISAFILVFFSYSIAFDLDNLLTNSPNKKNQIETIASL